MPNALVEQVAASDRVLAYSLSAGLVRVVNLETGGRTLLRSHTAEVCDVQVRCCTTPARFGSCSPLSASRCAGLTCSAPLPWTERLSFSSWIWCVPQHRSIANIVSRGLCLSMLIRRCGIVGWRGCVAQHGCFAFAHVAFATGVFGLVVVHKRSKVASCAPLLDFRIAPGCAAALPACVPPRQQAQWCS